MVIRMDDDKIKSSNENPEEIKNKVAGVFESYGLKRIDDGTDAIVYRDKGRNEDFSYFGLVYFKLRRADWFLKNAKQWTMMDDDGQNDPRFARKGDVLNHLKERGVAVGA